MRNGKATYPSIAGLEGAKARADDLYNDAMSQLEHVGNDTESLRWLSAYIVQRTN
jgi:farnesyl diphosphate synthase